MNRFAPENCVFFDFESRCTVPIDLGSYRYAMEADAIMLTYAIGLQPVKLVERRGAALTYDDLPEELRAEFAAGKIFCAFNTGFDRAVWNYALRGSPFMKPTQVIDARASALAHNLPPNLEDCSKRLGGPGKQKDGKKLIAMFCGVNAVMADDAPEEWERFCSYGIGDTEELRRIFRLMLPALTEYDWRSYQANEQVNDNGAGVDLAFCREAARLSALEAVRIGKRLTELTDGVITSINQNVRLAEWVHNRLEYSEAREIMCTRYKEDGADDEDMVEITKLSIGRGIVERLLDFLRAKECSDDVLMEILELREFGASAAPKKFQAILDQHIDGRLYGQFTFNGAGQTGRFSGRGVQLQNLTRSILAADPSDDYGYWEEPTVEMITNGCSLEELLAHGNGECAARKLALTIRPAFCASGTRTLTKADYSQVESRILPWISGSAGGAKLLDSFRESDRNPDAPDLYEVTAAGMTGKDPNDVSKAERQRGKVAVLACGFGGGRNALHSMAANYRLHFTDQEAQDIVDAWRLANPWAPAFWGRHGGKRITGRHEYPGRGLRTTINANVEENIQAAYTESYGLFGAARRAIAAPLTQVPVGRVSFVYIPLRRDGTLVCILPSGRPLIYPSCRMRDYDVVDKVTKKVLDTRHGLTFRRARGIIALYGGRFAENVTQAAAADLLRESIVWLIDRGYMVVSHSHDEIVVECERSEVAEVQRAMAEAMLQPRAWADGLPLAIDVSENWYYTASKQRNEVKVY